MTIVIARGSQLALPHLHERHSNPTVTLMPLAAYVATEPTEGQTALLRSLRMKGVPPTE